jgi:signal transduction histidine kinase
VRRRLVGVVAAVTAMVALAFLIPLGLLVKDLAADRAITQAENSAESIARLLVVLGDDALAPTVGSTVGEEILLEQNLSIVAPDGMVVAGIPLAPGEDPARALAGTAYRASVDGGQAVYVPVVLQNGTIAVVRAFVSDATLTAGVARSWIILGALGVLLVLLAVGVADRLGRSMVEPVRDLSATAVALGKGNLDARSDPSGPPEIEEVGHALNHMAAQIQRLIEAERETAADIAHRLRTPLTALHLDIEAIDDGALRETLSTDLGEMERTVDFVIAEARRPVRRDRSGGCDLTLVVADRIEFWRPLGEEQDRRVTTTFDPAPAPVEIPAEDVAVLVDALIENVFAHTEDGTALSVSTVTDQKHAILTVEDAGPGWAGDGIEVTDRGTSTRGSTGLGLDIVRRAVESVGGTITTHRSASLGGAAVTVNVPTATIAPRQPH